MSRLPSARRKAFIELVADGKNPTEAARQAGFNPPEFASQIGARLMREPEVAAAIRERRMAVIEGDLVPAALSCLSEIIRDKEAPAGVRVKASQVALQAGEYLGALRDPGAAANGNKGLAEMSVDELHALAAMQKERLLGALQAVEELRAETGAVVIEHQAADLEDDQAAADLEDDPAADPDPWD